MVFYCIRSQTRSALALVLLFMRRRRGDMPLRRALQLARQHMDMNTGFCIGLSHFGGRHKCYEEWILQFAEQMQTDAAERHERAGLARAARGAEGE